MEDMHSGPQGPQLYLLSEEGYEDLRNIQAMPSLMAKIAYSNDDNMNGNAMLVIPRVDLHYSIEELRAQIGNALDRLSKENGIGSQSRMWQ
jgi:hypothetical protein